MSSEFVGFRLHSKKDKDILDALSNVKNQTKEIKRLLRIAIHQKPVAIKEPVKQIDWRPVFTEQPKVSLVDNILSGFE